MRRMKSLSWLLLIGATLVGQAVADPCSADVRCREREEPRIKFLDDLAHPFRPLSHRDPYAERIETERHDFTQSTTTVGRGVFQLESGYTYFYKHEGEDREASHTTPELTLRLGLSEDIEFRLRWNYAWRFIENHDSLRGSEDMRWSLKLRITDQEGWLPESAWCPVSRSPPAVKRGRPSGWNLVSTTFTAGKLPRVGKFTAQPVTTSTRWGTLASCPRNRPASISTSGTSRSLWVLS